MHRQSLTAYGAPLRETTAPLPGPQGSEVLLRIVACGVCHSDLHLQDGHFDLGGGKRLDISEGRSLPFTLGHEIAGHVEASGPQAKGLDPRKLHVVYAWIGCGACARCTAGLEHLCDDPRQIGINRDGGYASHVLVPHPRYLIDAEGVDPTIAGSYMCSGLTAYGAIAKAQPYLLGRPLLILGLGGLGLMALRIAGALGIVATVGADLAPDKRQAALEAGASAAIDPGAAGARKSLLKSFGSFGAAIDFVGAEASTSLAQGVVGKGGAVVVVGLMGGAFSLPIPMFPLRELAILGSYVGTLAQARELMAMVQQGRIPPIPVSARPLAEANAALQDLKAGRVIGRIVLRP